MRTGECALFFGAGMSIPCGIPGWGKILADYFGLEKVLLEDDDLKSDPLTTAELASQRLGHEILQDTLRSVMSRAEKFSTNHLLLAALRLPIYITTNYDVLFEKAWQFVNGKRIPVVVNSADLDRPEVRSALGNGTGVLFKIHGCTSRRDEYLILTRRDYRRHYRMNSDFFTSLKQLLRSRHTLFLGFSHTDPEVSRLVEDTIYEYEHLWEAGDYSGPRPHFFSLQFDMRSHTPEVFAARGIVALRPPPVTAHIENIRSQGLGVALADMATIRCHPTPPDVQVYERLQDVIDRLSAELREGLLRLEAASPRALECLAGDRDDAWLMDVQERLGPLASQGTYLTDDQGLVVAYTTPSGIPHEERATTASFSQRPYFQQAKTFRTKFVSDTAASIFNQNSTFFLCCPLMSDGHMSGLLFAACQIGQWNTPLDLARIFWDQEMALLLVDSNGLCLLPPQNELPLVGLDENGNQTVNSGYPYRRLLSLSHRDLLNKHIANSVIPISLDDDVLRFADGYSQFSIISEIPETRWKVAVSMPVIATRQKDQQNLRGNT
ncbi:MAG: hypothetical protein GY854_17655 [Deltaproteobacteria bacterium]|nr:hypothetical protein [Deltaproteobacteria bacterium]